MPRRDWEIPAQSRRSGPGRRPPGPRCYWAAPWDVGDAGAALSACSLLFSTLSLSLSLSPFLSLSLSLFGGQLQDLRGASGGLNGVSQQDVVQRGVMRHRGVGKIF